jgi:branched-chain amino acid transport system permease protein
MNAIDAIHAFFHDTGWRYFMEWLFSGLTKGCIYALLSLGYTMVYGILELINFAHGEIYMLGAFTGLITAGVLGAMGFPQTGILLVAAAAAVIYCAAYGYTVEKIAYRPLRDAQRLSPLISAIGMSIFLQNYVLIAQTQDFLRFPNLIPDFSFLEPVADIMRPSSFVIIVSSAAIMASLTLFIKLTRLGKAMRATAQNRKMAMLLGINTDGIISLTFVIGSSLAAIGGLLIASHTQQINFTIGFLAGIKAFTAAVLGGIGSIPGAMLGGLVLGCCESFASGYIASDYEDMFAFAVLILILIFRPSGMLGKARVQKV